MWGLLYLNLPATVPATHKWHCPEPYSGNQTTDDPLSLVQCWLVSQKTAAHHASAGNTEWHFFSQKKENRRKLKPNLSFALHSPRPAPPAASWQYSKGAAATHPIWRKHWRGTCPLINNNAGQLYSQIHSIRRSAWTRKPRTFSTSITNAVLRTLLSNCNLFHS